MKLGDLIIEHGPFTQDLLVGPGFAGPLRWLRTDALNELREELIAARAMAELSQRFEVHGLGSEVYGGIIIRCRPCPWWDQIDTLESIALAELNRRAGEHAEVCR